MSVATRALEKDLETTAKMVKLGMKIVLQTQQLGKENKEGINALIEAQMRAEARMDRAEARMDRAETRMDRDETRMDRDEARMNRADAREEARQRRIDERINRLIASLLRKNPNGGNGRKR